MLHIFFTVSSPWQIFSPASELKTFSPRKNLFFLPPRRLNERNLECEIEREGSEQREATQQHIKIQSFLLCKHPQTVLTKKQDLSKSPESLAEKEILSRCQIKSCDHRPKCYIISPLTVVGLIFLSVMIIPAYKIWI